MLNSPSLIDLTVYKPRQTLLDQQDTYGYPSPVPLGRPYKDYTTDSSEEGRSEGKLRKLLEVAGPTKTKVKRKEVKQLNNKSTKESREVKSKDKKTEVLESGDGYFSITLPDGSNISFRPSANPTSTSQSLINAPKAGPVSLTHPVVATGFEAAFEAIKQLAIGGNGVNQEQPKVLPKPPRPNRKVKLAAPAPPVPLAAKVTVPPWSKSIPIVAPKSRLIPTAPTFKPARPGSKLRPSARCLAPPSPSTSPSPPLSNYTDFPPLISSSRTSVNEHNPPADTDTDDPLSSPPKLNQAPVIFTSPSALESLFKLDIKAIPWTKVDFPYQHRIKKQRAGGYRPSTADKENQVHVDQTTEEVGKKFDDILKSFGGETTFIPTHIPTPPPTSITNPLLDAPVRHSKPLKKYNRHLWDGAADKHRPILGKSSSNLSPTSTTFKPRQIVTTPLVDISPDLPVPKILPRLNADLVIYDNPDHVHLTLGDPNLYEFAGKMNGVETYDWQGGSDDVQDVNAYFDERDKKEQRVVAGPSRVAGGVRGAVAGAIPYSVLSKPLVDVSEFEYTIKKARTKEKLSTLPVNPYDRLLTQPSARASVPKHLCFSDDELQFSLMRSWIAAEPTDEQKRYVAKLAARLTRLVDKEFGTGTGSQRFTVDVFGSVSWGGETGRGGDVDMVVRDSFYPQGYHPLLWEPEDPDAPVIRQQRGQRTNIFRTDLSPVYDLRNVARLLQRKGFSEVLGIYGASTPIVKFKDPTRPGMEIDVNVNDLGGWYNSRLILAYCEISPHVLRPLIHALKIWSKANHVNDPSGKYGMPTMSSYCLTLMAIGYLQHCGILPNLQSDVEVRVPDYPDTDGKDVIWAGWGKPTGMKINVGFSERPPPDWMSSDPNMTAAQAVRGFFAYFARTGSGRAFQYNTQVVSILNGGIIDRAKSQGQETQEAQARKAAGIPPPTREEMVLRETMMGAGSDGVQPRNWSERRLVVQDPFIWQKNCTQAMSKQGLDRWMNAVDRAHQTLVFHNDRCDLDTLLANCLVPPPPTTIGFGRGGQGMDRATRDQMYGRGGPGGGRSGMGLGLSTGFQPRVSPYGRALFDAR